MKEPFETETLAREPLARCPECGAESPAEARFCIHCGSGLYAASRTWSAPPEPPPDPWIGRVIADRYHVLAHLGSGGMGVVYRVQHVHIGKVMALKVLHDELARRPDVQRRFRREAEAASRLASAHTVQVFDFGESDGRTFLVMEYVEGRSLEAVVEESGALPFARAARIAAQVCASVAEAHAHGIVHRDLKPENVMIAWVDGRETAKVLDFGLAKLRLDPQATTVTTTGLIVGTPEYMSPEQIRGEAVDARGDVYAIGAMLYHACTGRPPFEADAPFAVLTKHLTEPLVPPSRVAPRYVPPELDAIVEKAMAKSADDRYGSADELRAALVGLLRRAGEDLAEPALHVAKERVDAAPSRPRLRIGTIDLEEVERRGRTRARAPSVEPEPPKRRGLAKLAVFALVLAIASLAGAAALRVRPPPAPVALDPSVEHEPNDALEGAAELPERITLRGQIGQRRSPTRGDADVFRLVRSDTGALPVRVELGPIPNIDLVLEIFAPGQTNPRFVVDGGGVGEGEIAPNLPAPRTPYVVRVRERLAPGGYPIENVSDTYTLRWQRARVADALEREPNDSLETAQPIRVGGVVEGYVGTTGDVDVYCLEGEGGAIVARASGLAGIDLVLRVVDRMEARSRRVDAGGVGAGEESEPLAEARAGRTCFEVAAKRVAGGPSGSPVERRLRSSRGDERYTFDVLAAPPPSPAQDPSAAAPRPQGLAEPPLPP